jgi:hypothetical protein
LAKELSVEVFVRVLDTGQDVHWRVGLVEQIMLRAHQAV